MKLKNISVRFPEEACSPMLADGTTPNPFWNDIQITRILGVKAPIPDGGDLVFTGITNTKRFTPDKMLAIVMGVPKVFGKPADVYGYPCWLKLPASAANKNMPEVTEAAEVVVGEPVEGEEPTTRPRQWGEAHMAREIDGALYVPCSNGQAYWNGTVVVQVLAATTDAELVAAPPVVETEEI